MLLLKQYYKLGLITFIERRIFHISQCYCKVTTVCNNLRNFLLNNQVSIFLIYFENDLKYFFRYLTLSLRLTFCHLWVVKINFTQRQGCIWRNFLMCFIIFPDLARAVAARPISYAAVLRMKPDSSSSVLNSWSRPRQHHSGGLVTPDWPAFSSHPLSALSLLSSQEDYRSEGKTNGAVKLTVCLVLSELKRESLGLLKFTFKHTMYCITVKYPQISHVNIFLHISSAAVASDGEHLCTVNTVH